MALLNIPRHSGELESLQPRLRAPKFPSWSAPQGNSFRGPCFSLFISKGFFFFFFLAGAHPEHMEVPGPGIELEPQLLPHLMLKPLYRAGNCTVPRQQPKPLQRQCWILDPLRHSGNSSKRFLKVSNIIGWFDLCWSIFRKLRKSIHVKCTENIYKLPKRGVKDMF